MTTATQFSIGDKIRTNRYFGHTDFADVATIEEVNLDGQFPNYVIRYVAQGKQDGDFQLVRRSPDQIISADAPVTLQDARRARRHHLSMMTGKQA